LKFYFESEVATTQAGSVLFAFDYNATDSSPASKVAMMGYKGATKTVPWLDMVCTLDAREQSAPLWVRSANVPSGQDIKTYDPAVFFIAQTGLGSVTVGDIWVEYDISLFDPREVLNAGSSFAAGGTINNTNPFGTYGSQTLSQGQLPGTWSGATFTFNQPGSYIIVGNITGSLTACTMSTGTVTVGAVGYNVRGDGSYAVLFCGVTAVAGQTFILSSPTGTVNAADWFIATTTPAAITH